MRKWKRVDTADGPRFRSALAPHEAALLKNMVTSVQGMLDERESAAPSDPLTQITGIRTGHPQPPDDSTMRRLLPDFFKPQRDHPEARRPPRVSTARCAACTSPTSSTRKWLPRNGFWTPCPMTAGAFELTEDDANAWISAVNDVRLALGTMLDIGPEGPDRLPPDHPLAGHLDVYQWLTVLQEYLVLGLMGKPIR